MKLLTSLFAALSVLLLSSCAFLEQNIEGIGKGAVAVASAPVVEQAISDCVADDVAAQDALKPAAGFFKVGYDVITKRGADVPILTLVEESPAYYDQIPDQWDSIWAVLDGRDCGPVVAQWRTNSEEAFDVVQRVVAQKSRLEKACALFNTYAPVASLFSPVPIPSRVPGC